MKQVIIVGTGGHAKVVADIVLARGDTIRGFLTADETCRSFLGFPVLGREADARRFPDCAFVLAIGDPAARARLAEELGGLSFYTAVHPRAIVSALETTLGEGTVVLPNAVIGPCAKIGVHCIVNTAAVVEHDCRLADFVHVAPAAALAGGVSVGKGTHVGIGAAVRQGVSICENCIVGAGAVVTRDLAEPATYVGIPAKRLD